MNDSPLVAVWRASARVTADLLAATPPDALADRYSERTRTVAAQFAHIHYVRVRNLQQRGPDLLGDLVPFERGAQPGKRELTRALKASAAAMERLVARFAEEGAVRQWSGASPESFVAYHVAHEAHHRALAIVALRLGGHKLPSETTAGMWYAWRKEGAS